MTVAALTDDSVKVVGRLVVMLDSKFASKATVPPIPSKTCARKNLPRDGLVPVAIVPTSKGAVPSKMLVVPTPVVVVPNCVQVMPSGEVKNFTS